jgi:hypothetical protein
LAITKVKSGVRTLGTGEVAIGNISGSAAGAAGTFLKQDGTWAAVASGIEWQAVQTTGFTAVAEKGYPCNTTAGAFTVTLPASASVGDEIALVDYAGTFDTNGLTIGNNGLNIKGTAGTYLADKERTGLLLTYVDATQGWLVTSASNDGTAAIAPSPIPIDFLVVAGGGGGGSTYNGGGGGAGGYRTSTQTITLSTVITVIVGDGGAGGIRPTGNGTSGIASSVSGSGLTTISSAGGGGGATHYTDHAAGNGGSGGGGANGTTTAGGSGNTPSTSPSQGNDGGSGSTYQSGGGGGGAGAVGAVPTGATGAVGGTGTASSITGASVTYAGGGGGAGQTSGQAGGAGGGGAGSSGAGGNATVNTGGGGGGSERTPISDGGNGGKGVVILSVPTINYSTTTTGSPTVSTSGANTILEFTGTGSYTA